MTAPACGQPVFARPDTPEPTRARIYAAILQPVPTTDLLREIEHALAVTEIKNLHLPWVTADPMPYVASPFVCFRSSAARAKALPGPVVTQLLADVDSNVRTTMARHAAHLFDEATAERIDRDFRPDKKENWRPADDFAFSPQTLRRFATDPDPRMRCLAPRDPDLPPDLAERLAGDPDSSVRRAVADHRRLPTPALPALLADESDQVARAAARSPSLPRTQMDHLLTLAGV